MTVAARNATPAIPAPLRLASACLGIAALAMLAGCGDGRDATVHESASPSPFSPEPASAEQRPAATASPASSDAPAVAHDRDAPAAGAAPVAAAGPPAPAAPATTSADADSGAARYTSLEATDCRVLQVDGETGDSTAACGGVGGYRLQVLDADARMSVDVVTPQGRRHPLGLPSLVGGGGFSSLGPRAEWRLGPDGSTPQALIVRYLVQESEQAQRNTSYLVVARLAGGEVCAVGRVAPGPDQNERARRLADRAAGSPCLQAGATGSEA